MQLSKEASIAQMRLDSAHHYLVNNYNTPDHADSKIPPKARDLKARLDKAFEQMDAQHVGALNGEAAKKVSTEVELMTEELTALRSQIDVELSELLTVRATEAKYKVAGLVTIVLLFVGLAFFIQTLVTRYITLKLTGANEVFGKLAEGKFDNHIGEQPADELGQLMKALGSMQSGLSARVESDRKAAEADRARAVASERIKQALDASSVNVVVADDQYNVIYVNPAAQKLMN
jgi:methyl-accepting chemotaxis protein